MRLGPICCGYAGIRRNTTPSGENRGGMLGVLRGVNPEPWIGPKNMVAIRFWVESRLIVSTRSSNWVPRILHAYPKGEGPTSGWRLGGLLSNLLVRRMQETIDRSGNTVDSWKNTC